MKWLRRLFGVKQVEVSVPIVVKSYPPCVYCKSSDHVCPIEETARAQTFGLAGGYVPPWYCTNCGEAFSEKWSTV